MEVRTPPPELRDGVEVLIPELFLGTVLRGTVMLLFERVLVLGELTLGEVVRGVFVRMFGLVVLVGVLGLTPSGRVARTGRTFSLTLLSLTEGFCVRGVSFLTGRTLSLVLPILPSRVWRTFPSFRVVGLNGFL